MNKLQVCPCGSNQLYTACCGLYHAGLAIPATAEALMRSRYSAYFLKNEDYLFATWHPRSRPETLNLKTAPEKWIGLKIIATEASPSDEKEGFVEFVACYKSGGRAMKMREKSHFLRIDERWFYVDGV